MDDAQRPLPVRIIKAPYLILFGNQKYKKAEAYNLIYDIANFERHFEAWSALESQNIGIYGVPSDPVKDWCSL